MKIGVTWNPHNKFCVAHVHYSHDPEKNNPEWIAKAHEGMSDRAWQREMEGSFEVFSGKPVYKQFTTQHIAQLSHTPGGYMYGGWDFGYHRPAFVAAYINDLDQLCVIGEQLGKDEGIREFATRVQNWRQAKFPGAEWLEACDPAGHQKTDKAEFTSVEVLNSLGIYPTSKDSHIREGIEILEQRLLLRNDGQYGLIISPECRILIDGFKGGYRYPEAKDGQPESELPLKDGFYDHLFDALRYLAVNNFVPVVAMRGNEISARNEIMESRGGNDYAEFGL